MIPTVPVTRIKLSEETLRSSMSTEEYVLWLAISSLSMQGRRDVHLRLLTLLERMRQRFEQSATVIQERLAYTTTPDKIVEVLNKLYERAVSESESGSTP
jgi:hypothetical protein